MCPKAPFGPLGSNQSAKGAKQHRAIPRARAGHAMRSARRADGGFGALGLGIFFLGKPLAVSEWGALKLGKSGLRRKLS